MRPPLTQQSAKSDASTGSLVRLSALIRAHRVTAIVQAILVLQTVEADRYSG
jgi:hypothetical protein